MKKLLLSILLFTSITCFADTNEQINEACQKAATELTAMKAEVIDIKYSANNEYKAERCKYEILIKDSGATVNMQQESGNDSFKFYVLEKYSAWKFWK